MVSNTETKIEVESDHLTPGGGGLQNDALEALPAGMLAQCRQDLAANALPADVRGDRHALDFGLLRAVRDQRPAANDLLAPARNQEGCVFVRDSDVVQVRVLARVERAPVLGQAGQDEVLDSGLVGGVEGGEEYKIIVSHYYIK